MTVDLRALNAQSQHDWGRLLDRFPEFARQWRKEEWISYCWMLDHAVERHLGATSPEMRAKLRVLEIGFGSGRGLHRLIDGMGIRPDRIRGIEVLPERHAFCSQKWPAAKLDLLGGDPQDLVDWLAAEREAGGWFDLIFARHVMEHLPEDRISEILAGIAGLLPEGRMFAMIVPIPGTEDDEVAHLTDWPLTFEKIPERQLRRRVEATTYKGLMRKMVDSYPDTTWHAGWPRALANAHLPVVDGGTRRATSQHGSREAYAFCRRAA